MKVATTIILRPLLTEKSVMLQREGKYTFQVALDATKIDIRRAIEQLGQCEVASVNTMIVKGKVRRTRRGTGKTANWKKAIITLKQGSTFGGFLGEAYEA